MFENRYTAMALLLLCLVAAAVLLVGDLKSRQGGRSAGRQGILLLVSFLAVWCAALARVYPYIGTRHVIFLLPVTAAALGFLFAAIYRQKLWAMLVLSLLVVGASNASGKTYDPYITRENHDRALMTAAIADLRQSSRPNDRILVDFQSLVVLAYYFCGPQETMPVATAEIKSYTLRCGDRTIVTMPVWRVPPAEFSRQFQSIAHSSGMKPRDRVWVFETGWGVGLGRGLPRLMPRFRCLAPQNFGKNISVIAFAVAPDLLPESTVAACPAPAFNSFVE